MFCAFTPLFFFFSVSVLYPRHPFLSVFLSVPRFAPATSVCLSSFPLFAPATHLCLPVCPSFSLCPSHPSLSVFLSVPLFAPATPLCQSSCLSLSLPPPPLSVCLPVCPSLFVCLPVCPSLCPPSLLTLLDCHPAKTAMFLPRVKPAAKSAYTRSIFMVWVVPPSFAVDYY